MAGFKEFVRKGIHLGTGEHPVIDVRLDVGDAAQTVEVIADVPLINSENASVGQIITPKQAAEKSCGSLPIETKERLYVSEAMRGPDTQQSSMFSYLSPEERVPAKHPLRPIRLMVDEVLKALSPDFSGLYSTFGRPSIPPEKLLRALLLQVLYTVRSERMWMEQLEYNLLFRWFVGLNMDEAVWVPTVFTKNRDRLLEGDVAEKFFQLVLTQARVADLLSEVFNAKISRRHRQMILAIRRWTSLARSEATTPTSQLRIQMRDWRARAVAMKPSWRIAAT
jgi:transposase